MGNLTTDIINDISKNNIPDEVDLNSYYTYWVEAADQGNFFGRHATLREETYTNAEHAFFDPQVSACFLVNAFSVMKKDIVFEPVNKDLKKTEIKKSEEMAAFLNHTLEKFGKSKDQFLFDAMTAKFFHNSFQELVYDILKDSGSKYNGMYYYKRIKAKRPGLWDFSPDDHGNIDGYISLIKGTSTVFPLYKMFHLAWLPLFGNPHGAGDFARIRRFWKMKKEFIIFIMALGARQSKGKQSILKGDPDLSTGNDTKHKEALKKLNDNMSLYIPKSYDVDFNKFDTKILEDFERVINMIDRQIAMAMLSNSMTTTQNTEAGSYGMAKAQIQEGTYSFSDYACRRIERAMDLQYAKNLILLNYDLTKYPETVHPKCKLKEQETKDTEKQARIDTMLNALGILDLDTEIDLKEKRKYYDLPENKELFDNLESEISEIKERMKDSIAGIEKDKYLSQNENNNKLDSEDDNSDENN